MSEPYIGEIRDFGMNYCPYGWVPAQGGLLNIAGNEALYALLGTYYGGDGYTTFGLPDIERTVDFQSGATGLSCGTSWADRGGLYPVSLCDADGTNCVSKKLNAGETAFDCVTTCIATDGVFPPRSDATPWQSFVHDARYYPHTPFLIVVVLAVLLVWNVLRCVAVACYAKCKQMGLQTVQPLKPYKKVVDFGGVQDEEEEEEEERLNGI